MKKTSLRLFATLFLVGVANLFSAFAQNSAVIDPDYYRTKAHPYMIPDLPSGSDFYLAVKTGEPVYITLAEFVKGSVSFYVNNKGLTLSGDTVKMESNGSILVNYRKYSNDIFLNGFSLKVNYQADIIDRTIGSATYGKRPDFIWVNAGGSATVSAGPWMANYKWTDLNSNVSISQGKTDSVKILSQGFYQGWTIDGSGLTSGNTKDTISILEKPTFNPTAKTLSFPTTVNGISYKLMKYSSGSPDSVWTEASSFVGNGAAKSLNLTTGVYKLWVSRATATASYPYGTFSTNIATQLSAVSASDIPYTHVGGRLLFANPVQLQLYNMQGIRLLQQSGTAFALPAGGVFLFVATDNRGRKVCGRVCQ